MPRIELNMGNFSFQGSGFLNTRVHTKSPSPPSGKLTDGLAHSTVCIAKKKSDWEIQVHQIIGLIPEAGQSYQAAYGRYIWVGKKSLYGVAASRMQKPLKPSTGNAFAADSDVVLHSRS